MISMPEPFQTAEIQYRQLHASQLYDKKPSRRRHHWVGRLPSLRLPRPTASLGVVASARQPGDHFTGRLVRGR